LNLERRAAALNFERAAGALLTYNLLLHATAALAGPFLLPPVLARRKWRARLGQRLGWSAMAPVRGRGGAIWVHALSVGETLSALPLVGALRRRWPRRGIFFSTTTLTGQRIARQRLGNLVDGLGLFPYDLPAVVRARLRQVRPAAVILVETDLWPNFLARAAALKIPVALVNARVSRSSFDGYRRARALAGPMFGSLAAVAAQTERDARRLRTLGVDAKRLAVVGNLKFDQADTDDAVALAALYRRRLGADPDTPVFVAGSTHRGPEEEALAAACRRWHRRFPDLRVVVAPRDPLRAADVARVFRRQGLQCRLWRQLDEAGRSEPVVVVDGMGILRRLYAAASVAYVGGSLAGCGGHNPLEPAAMARPVLYGPDMSDFARVADALEQAGGAVRLADAGALEDQGARLLADADLARRMGVAARGVFLAHRGAVDRTLALIAELVES
jgi:3-deoxy-D-manno-octulosonic-acid transferase